MRTHLDSNLNFGLAAGDKWLDLLPSQSSHFLSGQKEKDTQEQLKEHVVAASTIVVHLRG